MIRSLLMMCLPPPCRSHPPAPEACAAGTAGPGQPEAQAGLEGAVAEGHQQGAAPGVSTDVKMENANQREHDRGAGVICLIDIALAGAYMGGVWFV